MIEKTIQELITTWKGRDEGEFLEAHRTPILIGVGMVDAALIRGARQTGTTWCMALPTDSMPTPVDGEVDSLVGIIFPVLGKSGEGQKEILIGRSPFCDIVLDHPSVSELHCQIERSAAGYTLIDQESTNGTLINGEKLPYPIYHALRDEDVLTLGQYSFQYFTARILFKYMDLRFE